MEGTATTISEICTDIDTYVRNKGTGHGDRDNPFIKKYENFETTLNNLSEGEKLKVGELVLKSVTSCDREVMKIIGVKILKKRKLVDWKSHPELVNTVFDTVIQKSLECDDKGSEYTEFLQEFIEMLASNNLKESYSERMFDVIRSSHERIDKPDAAIHYTSRVCCVKYPWVYERKHIPEHVKLVFRAVKYNPTLHEDHAICKLCEEAITRMFQNQKGYAAHTKVLDDITEMFKFCADQDWKSSDDSSKKSLAFVMLKTVMKEYLRFDGRGSTKPELVKSMIETIKKLSVCGEPTLNHLSNAIIMAMSDKPGVIGDDLTIQLIERFIKTQDMEVLGRLQSFYQNSPELMTPYLPEFTRVLQEEGDEMGMMGIANMMMYVARRDPQSIPRGTTDAVIKLLSHHQYKFIALLYLDALAPSRPHEILAHEARLVEMYQTSKDQTYTEMTGRVLTGVANTKDRQKHYLDLFTQKIAKMSSGHKKTAVLWQIGQVGRQNVEALREHRALIEKLKSDPELAETCILILDIMEGRNLEGVSSDVRVQRQDIDHLDTRVTHNEVEVKDVRMGVDTNTHKIIKVTEEVQDQAQKLNDLKQVVDETVERVDELDRKTLNHAPAWSRDVARLLTIQSDHDWRLLASRLGYRGGDIQGWATQPDPCLSMLDEWFATHNTREETNAVRKNLIEINRTDAAKIIDTALKSVENVINDTPGEQADPLPIFISYQWAQQKEAKLLRKHLALAGYPAYINVGQMDGGGGGLFSKIDSEIRAAKVVVCCVTKKYSESDNCTKEVNLSTALGKPMIPLLMEQMAWPPKGSMGPIFGEHLFIRFFPLEPLVKAHDERFWPPNNFKELLTRLRYHIAPEIDAIPPDSSYNGWWRPTQSIPTSRMKPSADLTSVEVPEISPKQNKSILPEVFISYQWDSQAEIKSLYTRLESLGYSCWLDTEQMGGGDSLYDKIDRGLRGCCVIICCVTTKREMSLADVLKKPIIPLKLERRLVWPPEGPMSLVLASLTAIDVSHCGPQALYHWNCAEFEVLHKALSHNLGRAALPLTYNPRIYQSQDHQGRIRQQEHTPFNSESQGQQNQNDHQQLQYNLDHRSQGQPNLGHQWKGQTNVGHQSRVQELQSINQNQSSQQQTNQSVPQKQVYLVSYPKHT